MKLELERRTLRLARPLETSYGALRERELLMRHADRRRTARAATARRRRSSPTTACSVERVRARRSRPTRRCSPRAAALNGAQLLDACRAVDELPQALAAIDMALWDRAGRRAGRPVAALLSDAPRGARAR